jgi:4-hydroxy-tetrahydrodipicolinate synthase
MNTNSNKLLRGVFAPTVTAFNDNGSLNENGTRDYIKFLIKGGVHGLAPMGSAGEFFAMSDEERMQVMEWILDETRGKIPVFAGTGHYSTETTIKLSLHAKKHGAEGLLLITPYFLRPPRAAVLNHFRAVHKAVGLPIMMYNVPILTGVEVPPDDLKVLMDEGVLHGVKWSHAEISRIQETRWACGPDFPNFAGIDLLIFGALAIGSQGMICGLPMLAPRIARKLFDLLAEEQKLDEARKLWMDLQPLFRCEYRALYSPIGEPHWLAVCREAAELRGIKVGPPRLPLQRLNAEHREELRKILQSLGEL